MNKFFNITSPYTFELGDWGALTMVINVALVIILGLSASWFGLAIALINLALDMRNRHRHINDVVLHTMSAILNVYFLSLLYTA